MRRSIGIVLTLGCTCTLVLSGATSNDLVVVGFDIDDIKGMLLNVTNSQVYVENMARTEHGDKVFIQFQTSAADRKMTAIFSSRDVKMIVKSLTVLSDTERELANWAAQGRGLIRDGWYRDARESVTTPDQTLLAKKSRTGSNTIVRATSPNDALFFVPADSFPRFLALSTDALFGMWWTKMDGELSWHIQKWKMPSGENLERYTIPEVGMIYDMHPSKARFLFGEMKDFRPFCFEYDLKTKKRRRIGLAREYTFYLRRDLAESLLKIRPRILFEVVSE